MTKISLALLKEHLYKVELTAWVFRGEYEFRPFLEQIAPIFNLDRFLGEMIGLPILHRRNYSASSVSETLEKAKKLAGAKKLRLYTGVTNRNEIKILNGKKEIFLHPTFYQFSQAWEEQKERIEQINNPKVLETLIKCLKKQPPTYYNSYTDNENSMSKGKVISTSFIGRLYGDDARDVYIKALQERLKIYDIGSGDTTGLVKLVEPGEQLSIEF